MSTHEQHDENAQQQTLRQLLSAKEDAFEAVQLAEQAREEQMSSREMNDFRAEISGTIRPFLFELRAIKRNYEVSEESDGEESDDSRDHWKGKPIATVTYPNGGSKTISGLEGVLGLEQPKRISVTTSTAGYGAGSENVETIYYYPPRVFTNAFYVALDWMGEVGLLPDPDKTVEPAANPVDPAQRFNNE